MKKPIRCRLGRHKYNTTMHVEPVGHRDAVACFTGICERCGKVKATMLKVDTRG